MGKFSASAFPGYCGHFGGWNPPHPRCPQCNMLIPWSALSRRHLATVQYARGTEQNRRRLAEEELREISERFFKAYGAPLENVTAFKYLVWVMMARDDDWPEVAGNLQKARKIWGRMSRVLIRERVDPKVSGHFFKAVVQDVLLFGVEMWVLTPKMKRSLISFQQRVARRLNRRKTRRRGYRNWFCHPLAAKMAEAGFKKIGTYVTRRQNTVAQYIATQTILDLCKRSARMPRMWVYRR